MSSTYSIRTTLDDLPYDLNEILKLHSVRNGINGIAVTPDGDGHFLIKVTMNNKMLIPVILSNTEYQNLKEKAFKMGMNMETLIRKAINLYIENYSSEE